MERGPTNNNKDDDEGVDITQLVRDCASQHLSVSDALLGHQEFNLLDAMGATQLLDTKMDCCQISGYSNNNDRRVFPRAIPGSLDDALSNIPWHELTLVDTEAIALELLVRLQSFFGGCSVSESVFTCLYAHMGVVVDMRHRLMPDNRIISTDLCQQVETQLTLDDNQENGSDGDDTNLPQWVIFAVTLGILECTDAALSVIKNADIYEEEDFYGSGHGISNYCASHTAPIVETSISSTQLKTTDILEQTIQKLKKGSKLRNILQFLREFLRIMTTFGKLSKQQPKRPATSLANRRAPIQSAIATLSALVASVAEEEYNESTRILLRRTFDSYVTRPMIGNLPVRKISFQKPKASLQELLAIVKDMDTHLYGILQNGSSIGRINRLLEKANRSNILVRSLILLNLYFDDKLLGLHGMKELVNLDLRKIPEPWMTSDSGVAFCARLAKPLYDVMKLKLVNVNRQRTSIEAALIPDWVVLQNEAQIVDYNLHNASDVPLTPHFSRYVLIIIVDIMDRYIRSGIINELFYNNHHDICFAFWYRDFVLSAFFQNLQLHHQAKWADTTVVSPAPSPHKGRGKKKHHKKTPNGKHPPPKRTADEVEEEYELQIISLKRNMCRKSVQFMAALQQSGVLSRKEFEFTSLETIFASRFDVFGAIRQPPPLAYQHFVEGNDFSNVNQMDLLNSVSEGFTSCRKTIDGLLSQFFTNQRVSDDFVTVTQSELKQLLKVCVGNAVYVQRLKQVIASKQSATVEFDFAHPEFCIFKLT